MHIVPILDYGDIIYDSLTKCDSDILQKLQNWELRFILKRGKRIPTADLHNELNLNCLTDRRKIHTIQYMFEVGNGLVLESSPNVLPK